MAGASLPVDGYISDDLRTEAEVKQALDDYRDVIARLPGSVAPEDLTISAGVITPTGEGAVFVVETEGAVPADDLDRIATTNMVDGSVCIVLNTSGNTVTVKHESGGTGQVSLQGGVDADLDAGVVLELLLDSTIWREKGRSWGDDPAPLRTYQGLGTAALANTGPGNGLDADTVDGQHASDFLGSTAKAADAEKLDGLDSTGFVQTATGASQLIQSVLRSEGSRFQADNPLAGQSSGFDWRIQNVLRIASVFDDITDRWRHVIYASDGTTIVAELRIDADDGIFQYDPDGSGTLYDVIHTGHAAYQPVKIVTLDSEYTIASPDVQDPIPALSGITFPRTPDGSLEFEIDAVVSIELHYPATGSRETRVRVHMGTTGDETDTVVFDSGAYLISSGEAGPDPHVAVHDAPRFKVTPGVSDLLTVSVERTTSPGATTRRHVLTYDDHQRATGDVDRFPVLATTYIKINTLD